MEESLHIKKLKITQVINETNDAKTLVLEPMAGWAPSYHAGQFITLVFYTKHGEKRRSYSISSSPELGEALSITIKKVNNGEFSRLLVHYAKVGDVLYTSGINGLFQLPENANEIPKYFFIAAGSGITPCFSLIKKVLKTTKSKVILIYSNKSEEDTIFYEQLKNLQLHYNNRFTIRFLFSSIFSIYQRRLSKWLLDKFLDEYLLPEENKALFYVCGPFEYMQTVTITLMMRVSAQQIFKENFSTLPRLVTLRPPDAAQHTVTIRFHGRVYPIKVQYPLSILAVAKGEKIGLPYSCEAGRCGSCVATCISGKIWMAYNEVLTDEEVKKGRVLVCQGYPIEGDAEIEF
jgi:ring-1,2-phenylacetyl-CoA epoxidase subunit PaaE